MGRVWLTLERVSQTSSHIFAIHHPDLIARDTSFPESSTQQHRRSLTRSPGNLPIRLHHHAPRFAQALIIGCSAIIG